MITQKYIRAIVRGMYNIKLFSNLLDLSTYFKVTFYSYFYFYKLRIAWNGFHTCNCSRNNNFIYFYIYLKRALEN